MKKTAELAYIANNFKSILEKNGYNFSHIKYIKLGIQFRLSKGKFSGHMRIYEKANTTFKFDYSQLPRTIEKDNLEDIVKNNYAEILGELEH